MRELLIKKCKNCGAYVKVFKDCKCKNCGVVCCGESMEVLTPNSVDAAFEKHVPTYEVKDGKLRVEVNHVMEEEHYIEWIAFVIYMGFGKVKLNNLDFLSFFNYFEKRCFDV